MKPHTKDLLVATTIATITILCIAVSAYICVYYY